MHMENKYPFSNSGNSERDIMKPILNDKGYYDIVSIGKENLDDYIQSFSDECNINNIIARFNAGDVNALNAVTGYYGDFTGLPNTLAQAFKLNENGSNWFDNLPDDIKKMYNNDYTLFLNAIDVESLTPKENKIVEEIANES